MVRGLEHFRDWFDPYKDHYVLIGGTACDLILDEAGLSFRATKDLDVVLMVDIVEPEFARHFWEYIHRAGYTRKLKSSGKPRAYRFEQPSDLQFPHMIELFARKPEAIEGEDLWGDAIPLPVDDPEVSSLSAILLDEEYFQFLRTGVIEIDGVPLIAASHLIVLKAQAWMNLRARNEEEAHVDSTQIKKHRNDIFRLFPVLDPGQTVLLSERIKGDVVQALNLLRDESIAMADMGINTMTQEEAIEELEAIYIRGNSQ